MMPFHYLLKRGALPAARCAFSWSKRVAALCLALGLMLPAVGAMAAEARVVVVNVERLLEDSASARAAAAKIDKEFAPRRQRVQAQLRQLREMSDKLAKDGPKLNDREHLLRERAVGELEREVRRTQAQMSEDFAERNAAERKALARRIHNIVLALPSQLGVDLVLTRTIWHRPAIDVTDKVAALLEK
ncbi:OmpH family outer membrane protein [Massilia niabensis]|uniref:OmpH family outer membrane protein n=1 Tax=Massilia niabensis TaxID=544910 RepID=A0ABW0KZ62_9BURK